MSLSSPPRRSQFFAVALAGALFLLSPHARADERRRHGVCSNATLKGTFGIYRTGTVDFGAGGLAAVGILSFDGRGNATVLQNISRNGDYNFDVDGTFNYELDPDCTGKGLSDGNEFFRMVVTGEGSGFYMMSESEGNAVYGVGTKIRD